MPDSTGSEPLVQVIDVLEKLSIPYVVGRAAELGVEDSLDRIRKEASTL